jgi:DNA-binding transcriptional MerR regulator
MSKEKTLKEVCKETGVSRRAVQGYERAELVRPSAKNSRGYLLYDASAQKRIREIKTFQDLGYSIKEIKEIIDSPSGVLKASLQEQIQILEKRQEQIGELIELARTMISNL